MLNSGSIHKVLNASSIIEHPSLTSSVFNMPADNNHRLWMHTCIWLAKNLNKTVQIGQPLTASEPFLTRYHFFFSSYLYLSSVSSYFLRNLSQAFNDALFHDQELMIIPALKNAKMWISMATRLGRFSISQDVTVLLEVAVVVFPKQL